MAEKVKGWIAPYPYSSNIDVIGGEWQPRLSVLSQMSADAAVLAWQQDTDLGIVVAGETLYSSKFPNTTDLMVERIKKQAGSDDIPVTGISRLSYTPSGD